MTFSIIGTSREEGVIGSAVASRWTGVGGSTQFFRPHVGMVNMQNFSNVRIAHAIQDNMQRKMKLESCIFDALETDALQDQRQCLIATIDGFFSCYTGSNCAESCRDKYGKDCIAGGNNLASADVVDIMIQTFEDSEGMPLAERLLLCLEAGQDAGGDKRGQEAAGLKVFRLSYPLQPFLPLDLRVDHHRNPLYELRRLFEIFEDNKRYMF